MENCNITAFAVETDCGEIQIEEVKALDFQLWFIDNFGDLLGQAKKPTITVSLFKQKDVPSLGVNIIPKEISDLSATTSQKTFLFQLDLVTSETVTLKAYANILAVVKICRTLLNVLRKRQGLTLTTRLLIVDSNTATMLVTVGKTFG